MMTCSLSVKNYCGNIFKHLENCTCSSLADIYHVLQNFDFLTEYYQICANGAYLISLDYLLIFRSLDEY